MTEPHDTPALRITARRPGHRRAGMAHPGKPKVHPAGTFTKDQVKKLMADPMLIVDPVELDGDAGQVTELVPIIAQLDPANPKHFTKGGVPEVKVLEERIGRPVSAAERDQAWALHQAAAAN